MTYTFTEEDIDILSHKIVTYVAIQMIIISLKRSDKEMAMDDIVKDVIGMIKEHKNT